VKDLKERIVNSLNKGNEVEAGAFTVRMAEGGRYPSWKEEFEKRLGEEAVQEVISNTPYKKVLLVEPASD
jgi:hypothetical protein